EENLSDKTWLEIISTPADKMKPFVEKRNKNGNFVEASPPLFTSSLEKCVKKQPNRFAKLALFFPDDCFPGYISSVFFGLANSVSHETSLDYDVVHQLMKKYFQIEDSGIASSILFFVQQTSEYNWSEDVLSIVIWLAHNHP